MESPVDVWVPSEDKVRANPVRSPFRLYFGVVYLLMGSLILLYISK